EVATVFLPSLPSVPRRIRPFVHRLDHPRPTFTLANEFEGVLRVLCIDDAFPSFGLQCLQLLQHVAVALLPRVPVAPDCPLTIPSSYPCFTASCSLQCQKKSLVTFPGTGGLPEEPLRKRGLLLGARPARANRRNEHPERCQQRQNPPA